MTRDLKVTRDFDSLKKINKKNEINEDIVCDPKYGSCFTTQLGQPEDQVYGFAC